MYAFFLNPMPLNMTNDLNSVIGSKNQRGLHICLPDGLSFFFSQ